VGDRPFQKLVGGQRNACAIEGKFKI